MKYNTAIVGATGAVGQEFLRLIEERNFPFGELKMLASARSAGKTINFMGKDYTVEETTEHSFAGVKFALFAGGAASKLFAPAAVDAGAVVIPEGLQHLDGAAALTFSRSRAYADGDFTRVSNQRKVIEAIVHRGLEAPASELYGLVRASASFLTTDSGMDVDFIYSLADQIRHNNDYPVTLYTATIPASTGMENGVSYVFADRAGIADMMEVFLAGGDISGGATEAVESTSSSSSSSSSTS